MQTPIQKNKNQTWQPLDRASIALMVVLSIAILLLIWIGDRTQGKVQNFSWAEQTIGAEDRAFILTFSRPVDKQSVTDNLQIDPPLPGKLSWAGRRMAYTLEAPIPYDSSHKISLQGAREYVTGSTKVGKPIEPFQVEIKSRDRAFVYIGVEGTERGQLILYNLTQNQKTVLTPKDITVTDFKVYPQGDRILFAAVNATNATSRNPSNPAPGATEQQLYTVTTGLPPSSDEPTNQSFFNWSRWFGSKPKVDPPGRLDLVLDNKEYQILKFDLTGDGKTILVQRMNRQNPGQFGLWVIRPQQAPKAVPGQPGGDFVVIPNSETIAIAQGQGVAILPLDTETASQVQPIDFLPKFGTVLSFNRDGTAATMVKFNTNYTRSLFLVNNRGLQKEIFRTNGSIFNCLFAPTHKALYCLVSELIPGQDYQEQPYIAAINLEDLEKRKDQELPPLTPLLILPKNQRDIALNLSPDGLVLAFDQVISDPNATVDDALRTDEGAPISSSRLWLLPLAPDSDNSTKKAEPLNLPLPGLHPRWIP